MLDVNRENVNTGLKKELNESLQMKSIVFLRRVKEINTTRGKGRTEYYKQLHRWRRAVALRRARTLNKECS